MVSKHVKIPLNLCLRLIVSLREHIELSQYAICSLIKSVLVLSARYSQLFIACMYGQMAVCPVYPDRRKNESRVRTTPIVITSEISR